LFKGVLFSFVTLKYNIPHTYYCVVHADSAVKYDIVGIKDGDQAPVTSTMDSILSLDDGRWSHPTVESCSPVVTESREDFLQSLNIKQPLPPPVLAQVHPERASIPPSKVADPRPGPAKSSHDSGHGPTTYQHLHIVSLF
jgi:STAM-binding protein